MNNEATISRQEAAKIRRERRAGRLVVGPNGTMMQAPVKPPPICSRLTGNNETSRQAVINYFNFLRPNYMSCVDGPSFTIEIDDQIYEESKIAFTALLDLFQQRFPLLQFRMLGRKQQAAEKNILVRAEITSADSAQSRAELQACRALIGDLIEPALSTVQCRSFVSPGKNNMFFSIHSARPGTALNLHRLAESLQTQDVPQEIRLHLEGLRGMITHL